MKIKMENHEELSEKKLFCPNFMMRFDQTTTGYNPVWVCRICYTFILSEDAVRNHLTRCNRPTGAKSDRDDSLEQNKSNKSTSFTAFT
jgi:hypothetical protein